MNDFEQKKQDVEGLPEAVKSLSHEQKMIVMGVVVGLKTMSAFIGKTNSQKSA